MSDSTVEIKITGKLDPSLKASTDQAVKSMGQLNLTQEQARVLYNQFGGDLKKYEASLQGATSAAAQAGTAARTAADSTRTFTLATSQATHELVTIGDEVLRGDFSRIPGSFLVLANRSNLLTNITGTMVLKFAALAGAAFGVGAAISYAAEKVEAYNDAMRAARLGAAFSNNLVSEAGISAAISKLSDLGDVSSDTAQKTVVTFSSMRGMTDQVLASLTDHIQDLAAATHTDMPKAAAELKSFIEAPATNGPKFLDFIGASSEQIKSFLAAAKAGNADALSKGLEVFAHRMDEIDKAGGPVSETIKRNADQFASFTSLSQGAAGGLDDIAGATERATEQQRRMTGANAAAGAKNLAAAMQDAARAVALLPPDMEQVRTHLTELEADTTKTRSQILSDEIGYLQKQKAAAGNSAEDQIALDRQIAEKRVELARQTSQEIVATRQAEAAQKSASSGGNEITGLRAGIAADQAILADARVTADAKIQIAQNLAEKQAQLSRASATQVLIADQEEVASARRGSQERVDAAQREVNDAIRLFGKVSSQAKAAEATHTQAVNEQASERLAIAIREANTRIRLANMVADAERRALTQQAQYEQIDAETEITEQIATENRRYQIVKAELDKEAKAAADQPEHLKQINDQKEVDYRDHMGRLARINQTGVDKLVQQYAKAWAPATQGFDTFLRGVMSGNQTLVGALRQGAAQMVQDWILAQVHKLEETIFTEAAQTAAVAAGGQARVAAQTAAAAEGSAISTSAGSAQIMNDAHEAAAATYKSVAQIPYVGPYLAPIAAAGAFVAVAAFDQLTSFDVGTSYVPRDMTANIHYGEGIVPKNFNDALRAGELTLGGPGAFDGDSGQRSQRDAQAGGQTIHVEQHNTFNNSQSAVMRMMKNRKLVRQMATDVGRHMALNPSTRGSY